MERYKILNWYGNIVYGMEKLRVSKIKNDDFYN